MTGANPRRQKIEIENNHTDLPISAGIGILKLFLLLDRIN